MMTLLYCKVRAYKVNYFERVIYNAPKNLGLLKNIAIP